MPYNPSMPTSSPYVALLVTAPVSRVEHALVRILDEAGYRRAPGLAPTPEEHHLDPHLRSRRFFRLREMTPWTAILEHGCREAQDYLLVGPLGALRLGRVLYAALSQDHADGVLTLQVPGQEPEELWLEAGVPVQDLTTLSHRGKPPMELLSTWDAPASPPTFEEGQEPIQAFLLQPTRQP